MEKYEMRDKKIFLTRRIIAILCVFSMIVASITYIPDKVQAATKNETRNAEKVSSSEQKQIKKFLDRNVSGYLDQCCISFTYENSLKMNPKMFKFDNKRKTDMAVNALNPNSSLERERISYEDELWQKYIPYGGLWVYSKKQRER